MNQQMPHKRTPLAILAVFLLIIPGVWIGRMLSVVFILLFLTPFRAGWFSFDLATAGWFDIVLWLIIPDAILMPIVGFLTMRITFAIKSLQAANYAVCAYAATAVVACLAGLLVLKGATAEEMIEGVAAIVGVMGGLYAGYRYVRSRQAPLAATHLV
jgi:hypothetical protein